MSLLSDNFFIMSPIDKEMLTEMEWNPALNLTRSYHTDQEIAIKSSIYSNTTQVDVFGTSEIYDNYTNGTASEYVDDIFLAISIIERYLMPMIFILGVTGNIVSFAVFCQKPMRHSSTSILFRLLAVADTLALLLYNGLYNIPQLFKQYPVAASHVTCKLWLFSYFYTRSLSAWILVVVCCERLIAVILPLRARHLCTERRAWYAFILVAILIAIPYFPLLESSDRYERIYNGELLVGCATTTGAVLAWYGYKFFTWMDLVLSSLLPFTLIFISNITIIYGIKCSQAHSSTKGQGRSPGNMIPMLISISVAFVLLSIVEPVYLILMYLHKDDTGRLFAKILLLSSFAVLCDTINHSINMLLYCVTGRRFRRTLRGMLCGRDKKLRTRSQRTFRTGTTNTGSSKRAAACQNKA